MKKNPDGSYSFGNGNQISSQSKQKSADNAQQTIVKNADGSYSILTSNRTSSQTKSSAAVLQSATSGGPLVGVLTIDVKKDSLNHFDITIVPDTAAIADTVAFTEGAKLIIQAQNKDSVDIEYDGNTLLKFSLTTNEEYGTFIKSNGDTLKTTLVELTDVLYSDAKAGKIKFAAVKKNPDSLVTCKIHVEKQDDPTKLGERDVVVLEQTLKIVMERPYQVRPSIPTENGIQALVNQRRKPFEVRMTRGGKPVSNHPFRLSTEYIDSSGGHHHIAPRREASRENYGHIILRRTDRHVDRPYNGATQANGQELFYYVSSIFGELMSIVV
jgi:hypothetical protein